MRQLALIAASVFGSITGIAIARRRGNSGLLGVFVGSLLGSAAVNGIIALIDAIFRPPTLMGPVPYVVLASLGGLVPGCIVGGLAMLIVWSGKRS